MQSYIIKTIKRKTKLKNVSLELDSLQHLFIHDEKRGKKSQKERFTCYKQVQNLERREKVSIHDSIIDRRNYSRFSLHAPPPSLHLLPKKGEERKKNMKGRENFAQNPIDKQTETKSGGSLKSNNVHSVGGAFSRRELEGRDRAPIGRRSDVLIQMQHTHTHTHKLWNHFRAHE